MSASSVKKKKKKKKKEATRIADALWSGEELEDGAKSRVIGLFRLTFRDPGVVTEQLRGEPIYLLLAMTPDRGCSSSGRRTSSSVSHPPPGGGHVTGRRTSACVFAIEAGMRIIGLAGWSGAGKTTSPRLKSFLGSRSAG